MAKRVALGADHGGFALKEKIKEHLIKRRHKVRDEGTFDGESCDYPLYGFAAAAKVSRRKADRAIVICKSGIGMSIVANKLKGVRAGLCHNTDDAVSARKHNDTNVLVLAAEDISGPDAIDIVDAWMRTRALKGRHARRVRQIKDIEKKVFK
jgi:ribose 5-phosphate isomerase B